MGCVELCGPVHTAQRQISTQVPIEFCVNLSVSVSVLFSVSVGQRGRTVKRKSCHLIVHISLNGNSK